ncbi:MAG: glycosyltransferase family 4 protein [Gemmatimonadetes bacterium]|nr:glycosyltransferase family 4 protein [Gemmatimonadota bacterium]
MGRWPAARPLRFQARLRIVFLTHNFPRFPGDVSGAFLASLAGALRARGTDVRVVAPSDGGEVGAAELDGVPVRRIRYGTPAEETLAYRGTMADAGRSLGGALRALAMGRALRRAVREELQAGAELVHAHWWIPGGMAAPPEAPLVVTCHGTDVTLLRTSAAARALAQPVFRRARVVTTVSTALADVVRQATGREVGPAYRQPMPAATERYVRWSESGGGWIAVARLTRQKRIDLVLDAVALLRQEGHRTPLTLVGDGPERAALESRVRALGLEASVRFDGAQPPAVVAERLQEADLAIFAAEREGYGLAAAEALMAGVPVVACTDGGGVLDVVPATGAGRHASPDASALAAAIRALGADPDARPAARALGATLRLALSPAHVAEVCEGWYREALRG